MTKKVCIIDDDDDVRDIMSYALQNEAIDTMTFKNARLALEALPKLSPNDYPGLIIVDFLMPEMNGVHFVETLMEKFPDTLGAIPIALSTANRMVEGVERLPERVIRFPKPIELDEFLHLVQRHLK